MNSSKLLIKRAGDAKPNSDAPVSKSVSDETSKNDKWSSVEGGGNLLNWLAQKTQQKESRGAIDYLEALQKKKESAPSIPKPRSLQTETSSIGKNHIEELCRKIGADHLIQRDEEEGKNSQERGPPDLQALSNLLKNDSIRSERDKVNEESKKREGNLNRREERQRGVRSNRRKETYRERMQRRAEEQEVEVRKIHEEAMRTNPEYKKQYQNFQEMQSVVQAAQKDLLDKYRTQKLILPNQVATERLDLSVIVDLIEEHDVVFICTDTGTGKSTTIPKALLESSSTTRVVSTQPRRTATVSIANRVASLRRENVGEDVGYWIRGEKKGDEQTRLWYMTSYTLLLRLLESPLDVPFTHIVLDEFHERQPDLEVTVALLRLALLNKTAKFKLILMSATLNTEDWEQYFSGLKVATYKQSEPEHPIHDYFLEDICCMLGLEHQLTPSISKGAIEKNILDRQIYLAQGLITFLNSFSNPQHAILLFLPGRAQVESMQTWLDANFSRTVDSVPWHSAIDLSVIEEAIKRQDPNRQKIYLATDIAEVSITIPDVVFVIDTVLVKRPKISQEIPASILYPPLVMQWISKGSVAQRRGRIGRVQQGFYFCLFSSSQINELSDFPNPPIENARIDELSLHCLELVSNPVAIFTTCHGQPLMETIDCSMNMLTQLGCIINKKDPDAVGESIPEVYHNNAWQKLILSCAKENVFAEIEEYEYTFIGRILQLIPVSPQQGLLVYFGLITGLESIMILAAAVTCSLSPFSLNPAEGNQRRRRFNVARAMEDTENVMRDMCCGLRSDIVAVMKATLLFRLELAKNGDNINALKQWCIQKHLSYDKLLAIVDLDAHIKYELANFIPFRDIESPDRLLDQLEKLASMVIVMTNVAFASQSFEVTTEGNTYKNSQEAAVGIFSDLTAVPDIHSPSCLRWQDGDIIIPVQLGLIYDKLLAGFATAISSPKQFWLSLLLFCYRVRYAMFSDEIGAFYVFSLSYCGKERFIEVDENSGAFVIEFRKKVSDICKILRLSHTHRDIYDNEFANLLNQYNLAPLQELQRQVITSLVKMFKNMDDVTAEEVEHNEDDLDVTSTISFALERNVPNA